MKKFLLSLLLLTAPISLNFCQEFALSKGSTILTGMGSYSNHGGNLYGNAQGKRTYNITLASTFYYFVVPRFSIGSSIAFTRDTHYNYNTFGIGPVFGYFFGDDESTLYPYLSAGIRYYSMNRNLSIAGTDIMVGGGVLIPVKKHIAFAIEAGYRKINIKNRIYRINPSGDIISIGVGISGLFF